MGKVVFVEIELDKVIASKSLVVPENIVDTNQYIRNYFKWLGYNVGEYLRIC